MYYDTLRDKRQLFTLVEGTPEFFLLHSRRFLFFIVIFIYFLLNDT